MTPKRLRTYTSTARRRRDDGSSSPDMPTRTTTRTAKAYRLNAPKKSGRGTRLTANPHRTHREAVPLLAARGGFGPVAGVVATAAPLGEFNVARSHGTRLPTRRRHTFAGNAGMNGCAARATRSVAYYAPPPWWTDRVSPLSAHMNRGRGTLLLPAPW